MYALAIYITKNTNIKYVAVISEKTVKECFNLTDSEALKTPISFHSKEDVFNISLDDLVLSEHLEYIRNCILDIFSDKDIKLMCYKDGVFVDAQSYILSMPLENTRQNILDFVNYCIGEGCTSNVDLPYLLGYEGRYYTVYRTVNHIEINAHEQLCVTINRKNKIETEKVNPLKVKPTRDLTKDFFDEKIKKTRDSVDSKMIEFALYCIKNHLVPNGDILKEWQK